MSRLFYHTMQDNVGNLLFGVSGTMRVAGTGTAATIYGDEALTVIIPNPMTNHPSFGSFKCYLPPGSYDFYMAKAGYTFETLTGVQGLGTMAQENAAAANINDLGVVRGFAGTWGVGQGFAVGVQLEVTGTSKFNGPMGINGDALTNIAARVTFNKNTQSGQIWQQTVNDTGPGQPVILNNASGTQIGSISTTGSATAYNTSSDVRLKHAITPLTGALDVVTALRPVAFRWNSDDSLYIGFLGHELQREVPTAVTGEADAVNPDGSVKPMQVDHSKLVPILVSAVKELLARVEVLEQALA